jgi:SagB-type dehydrogenase family enzyme
MDTDLAEVLLRRRHTSFNAIDTSPLRAEDLATVLAYAARGDDVTRRACGGQIYCVVARVQGIPAGTYRYVPAHHALAMVNPDAPVPLLMRLAMAPNIQMHLAPVNIFLAGDYRKAGDHFGERGFRIMGIELGRLIQRISLAAAALDLASHTHFSYRIGLTARQLLRLPTPSCLPLVSLMLGYPRRAQGGLFEAAW